MKTKAKSKRVIGKYQRYSKNVKRFEAGGVTGDGELSLDNLSFGQAFNAVRNMVPDAKVFTWRGKKYSTAMAPSRPTVSAAPEEPVNARAEAAFRGMGYTPPSQTASAMSPEERNAAAMADFRARHADLMNDPLASGRIEQSAPETWGLGGALKGAAALGTTALGARALLKAGLANEARAASKMAGEAEKMEMIRRSRALNAQRTAAAEKRAATMTARKEAQRKAAEDAAEKAKWARTEDWATRANKRGGQIKSRSKKY